MHYLQLWLGPTLLSLVAGCTPSGGGNGDKNGSASSMGQVFFSLNDLQKPSALEVVSTGEITGDINSTAQFFATSPASKNTATDCMNQALFSSTGQGSGSKYSYKVDADFAACEAKKYSNPGAGGTASVSIAHLRFDLQMDCPGTDFSAYNGQSVAQVQKLISQICLVPGATYIGAMEIVYKGQVSASGKVTQIDSVSRVGIMNSNSQPCSTVSVPNSLVRIDDCHTVSVTVDASGQPNSNSFVESVQSGLTAQVGDLYFRSGQVQYTNHDWHGVVSYSGANIPPTWSLQNSSGQTAAGSFSYKAPSSTAQAGSTTAPANAAGTQTTSSPLALRQSGVLVPRGLMHWP